MTEDYYTEHGDWFECRECSALVVVKANHTAWHQRLVSDLV